jgi:dTDP-4-amino-4,6-dideoxygalactose transaminase
MNDMASNLAIHGGAPARTTPFPAWPQADDTAAKNLAEVHTSGLWGSTHGARVAEFEGLFAAYQDAAHCVAVSNGTLAIDAALRALGVGPGDEVILPPYTFIASASAVLFVGAVPVFADVDPGTHLLDADAVRRAITPKTKAIMAVHIAGRPCDMDAILAVAGEHGLPVLEDSAQAHGAAWRGRKIGAIGNVGTFSFQTSKNISSGEGGAVVTNDDALANTVYSLANVGRVREGGWYEHHSVGYNLRLTEFQAAILLPALARHPEEQAVREAAAVRLSELLSGVDGVRVAAPDDRVSAHGRHLFVFRVPGRRDKKDAIVKALAAEGLPCSGGYVGLHRNDAVIANATRNAAITGDAYTPAEAPVCDELTSDTIWLTQNVLLAGPDEQHDVADAIAKVLGAVDSL